MHRSTSSARDSDEHSPSSESPGASAAGNLRLSFDGTPNAGLLPVYSPSSHASKRDRSRLRSAVHLIPLVLILCAIVLWLFSNPVAFIRRSSSVVSWTEKIMDASAIDVEGTHTNFLSH